jgi:hypothetical protein
MSPDEIARLVVGLFLAVLLAVIGAHPKVRRWEQRFGLTVLTTTGFPMLVLGWGFREFGILTDTVLADLRPAYELGLGWIGFVVGMHFNMRAFERLPSSFMAIATLLTVPPTLLVIAACSLVLIGFGLLPGSGLYRDVLVLGACAAVSAPANLRLLLRNCSAMTSEIVTYVTRVDQLAALAVLAFAAIYFRPARGDVLWHLPRSGWFVVMLGVGFLFGVIVYLLLRGVDNANEELALLLGGIALAAGMAGYLALSVPVVCALGGMVLANAPLRDRESLEEILAPVERWLYLLFLFIVGAWWRPNEWEGWLLAVIFAVARGYGKYLGARAAVRVAPRDLPPPRTLTLAILPESPVAIVVMLSIVVLHGPAPPVAVGWAINAVIGGSIMTEIFVQARQRREAKIAGEETGPMVAHVL